jgi:GxxExxY protein
MSIRRPGGLLEERLSYSVIGAFLKVHRTLGFGFMESVYGAALEMELLARGHRVAREVSVAVRYEGVEIAHQRLDMIIDEALIVEIKASERLPTVALRQLYNYLRATDLEVGLVLHFGPEAKFYRAICDTTRKRVPSAPAKSAEFVSPNPSNPAGENEVR